jgi:hypothetical protein
MGVDDLKQRIETTVASADEDILLCVGTNFIIVLMNEYNNAISQQCFSVLY